MEDGAGPSAGGKSFMDKVVGQTREETGSFVGSDVRVYGIRGGRWCLTGSRSRVTKTALATRMSTKSPDVTGKPGEVVEGRLMKPRLVHARVDSRGRVDKARSLVPWVTLMCDMLVVPEFVGHDGVVPLWGSV